MESPSAAQQQPPSATNAASGPSTPASTNNPPLNPNNAPSNGATADPLPMEDVVSTNAVTAEVIARQNQAVVEEFQYLLEKSQQLFAGLRDLPPTGAKQWQPYFQKTFEIFSKVSRRASVFRIFTSSPSSILTSKLLSCVTALPYQVVEIPAAESLCAGEQLWIETMGSGRDRVQDWPAVLPLLVSERADFEGIGRLTGFYSNVAFLRTSETNYLQESYVFYDAIRERRYFNEISDIKNSALMIKKLRYYARFTVVCLLLNNRDIISTLKDELAALVKGYIAMYRPPDAAEWELVVQEVTSFTDAEKKLHPVNTAGSYLPVARRLHISKIISAALDKEGSSSTKLKLQEAILVGNAHNQIKFSELTIDMYRMLQSLERETSQIRGTSDATTKDASSNAVTAAAAAAANDSSSSSSTNIPLKEEPTEDQSITVRRNTEKGTKRLNPHKYLLYRPTLSQLMVYLATAFKEVSSDSALLIYLSADGSKRSAADHSGTKGYHGGILTNSRKVADNTDPEQQSISHCLHPGDLLPFTRKPMFLIVDSNNSVAFADMPRVFSHPFMSLLSPTEYPASIPDKPVRRFLQDEFLRQFMIRFALCYIILKAHTAFTEPKHLPASYPMLPASVLESPDVLSKIRSLAVLANANCFSFEDPIVTDIAKSET
ncbi:hypothetical protein BGX26_009882 [Mortierella sp. AD094]|nr:hypothetical protein BGX26_009882 [Mortierella sp. AD094]